MGDYYLKNLLVKLKESSIAVLPILITVLTLSLILGAKAANIGGLVVGALMLIIGMTFFTLGADVAIMPIGELMGSGLTKTRKLILILIISFITGLLITIAEPGLMVLGEQLNPIINKWILVITVGAGVGIFLMISMLRTIFKLSLNVLLLGFYIAVFTFAIILSVTGKADLLTVAFDSGGATTGAITVPFVMAFGIGIASIKGKADADDNFGLIALCSIGPILAVLILSIVNSGSSLIIPESDYSFSFNNFLTVIPNTFLDVGVPILMLLGFFLLFQVFIIHVSKSRLIKIFIGLIYTMFGLMIFLIGANVGFMPIGNWLGNKLGQASYRWVLIPIGFVIGCFIIAAEPSIQVLNKKVEEISDGIIKSRSMLIALMIGVGMSIALSMIRVLFDISIWWIIAPGYLIAIVLTFFTPKIFTAVAFDSGGVASGPMTSAFLLPLAMGACEGVSSVGGSGDLLAFAFGVIALVAMTPLITIQLMGFFASLKAKRISGKSRIIEDYQVIDLV